ncbi:MAG: glycosyltransferase [Planctomycetota bacterium]
MQNEPRPQASPTDAPTPEITVLFPTYGRPDRAEALLGRLAEQTLEGDRFEVVVVDDGSRPQIDVDVGALPYRCTLIRQPNGGPASARNAGLALTRAPLVLILNDDAVPAPDLLEKHLAAHAEVGERCAVLGTFHFTEEARRSAFTRLLDESDLLFTFSGLEHGRRLGWDFFWTCNISLPLEGLLSVGGFDAETFDRAICEDVELGMRLEQQGWSVVHREDCVAEHDHVMTPAAYFERAFQLGRFRFRLGDKIGRPEALFPAELFAEGGLNPAVTTLLEELRGDAVESLSRLEELDARFEGRDLPPDVAEEMKRTTLDGTRFPLFAGLYHEHTGVDAREVMEDGAPEGTKVSIVVVSCDALRNTQRCIGALRDAQDERYEQEILVVDNGSTDGSAEWLAEQPDVELIRNAANHGAPRARNQAIARATGDWIAFLDNDVFVPVGWLDRALYHGAVDPGVGAVPLCANRASKHQVVPYEGSAEAAAVQRFADQHFASQERRGADATLFTSLAVLVRAEVLDRIGGFDEAFSPWGFEDDDLSLRVRLAGWRNRVARDTFVYHAPYDGPAKHQRHAAWLEQNWKAFLAKWSPDAPPGALFDYSQVRVPQLHEVTEAQLVFELPPEGAAPPTWPGAEQEAAPEVSPPESKGTSTEASTGADHGDTRGLVPAQPAPNPARAEGRADLLVIGCGRSGTSMVAGMLADAGWGVGDDPYPGREANPKGFFETAEINGINEYLLATAVTNEPPLRRMQHWLSHAPEPLDLDVDEGLRARMDRLGTQSPYAYKDPRFCYTLDAWRPSVPGARFVCVFREPAATAASILKECGNAAYLADVDIDFDRALDVWDAMYRRVLDDHARDGEWLFVHFDELLTPEGVGRLEEFVGAPVAAEFPEKALRRSRSERPVPARIAETYRRLCERAGYAAPVIDAEPAAPTSLEVDAPELTVLICTYDRLETLKRCLSSFERQSAAGRYEIVVVNDGSSDGTREWLDGRQHAAPVRVVHQANGGLSAARNAGLDVARGTYVLLVNDDTIASPELVAEHLAAHAEHGPDRAVLGTFEQPRAALDNALMRTLEDSFLVFCYAGLDPAKLHDWTRFWTCNVSVSRAAVEDVGRFDEEFRHYGCEDTDLGYRLETLRDVRVVFHPAARAEHEHVLTFEDLRRRNRTVASAFVRFFRKHPGALVHPGWRARAGHTLAAHESLLVETLPDRARAEAFARELGRIDVGALERTGPEGEEIARAVLARLRAYLEELNHLWWADGEAEAFRAFGLGAMAELLDRRQAGARPGLVSAA